MAFAYDVGLSINLESVERVIGTHEREQLRHDRKGQVQIQYRPRPVRVQRASGAVQLTESFITKDSIEITVFDFGAISVMYTIEFEATLKQLRELGHALYENAKLLEDSRAQVQSVLSMIYQGITRPGISQLVEDYVIYKIDDVPGTQPQSSDALHAQCSSSSDGPQRQQRPSTAAEFIASHSDDIAGVLRAELRTLSAQEVHDSTSDLVSYTPEDAAIVDWNAAFLIGKDMNDVLAVLEFVNVELLEMRLLDEQLDRALERAYAATALKPGWIFNRKGTTSLRDIAGMQVDAAQLFETVNNTLKLLGDQYLARIYRVAADQLHLPSWDSSVLRKLDMLERIYEKIIDRQTTWRMEVLEWIIIILIAFEVVRSFF